MKKNSLEINIGTKQLDEALEKANKLKEVLTEVHELIRSLSNISQKD